MVKNKMDSMIYPVSVKYLTPESTKGTKLVFVEMNQKKICCATNLLFDTKEDAELYAVTSFIKMYYSFDPLLIADDVDEETLQNAHKILTKYEAEDPAKFIYYWMMNVPSR